MPLKTWRLWASYLGTHFAGFQQQPGQKTIESALQEAFLKLMGFSPKIISAGRTDAGVHARGQVLSCLFESDFDPRTLPFALSHFLGPHIAVYRADEMHSAFDAKRQSVGKRYIYRIGHSVQTEPFDRLFTWHMRTKLDLKAMQEAADFLVGDHDFESFRSTQCVSAHAKRYIWVIRITPKESGIWIDIRGNAFCHNMVRIIVGTLVEVGLGRKKAGDVAGILAQKNRSLAGQTAPPQGLTLETVYYPDDLSEAEIPENARFPRYPVSKESWPC